MRSLLRRLGSMAVLLLAALAATPAAAQIDLLKGGSLLGGAQGPETAFTVSGEITPASGQKPAVLSITARMQPGYHIYSITQKPGGPLKSRITVDPSPDFRMTGDLRPITAPDSHPEPLFDNLTVETHEGEVTWQAPIDLNPNADPAKLKVTGKVNAQACNAGSCLPPASVPFTATLKGQSSAAAVESGSEGAQGTTTANASAPPRAVEGRFQDDQLHTRLKLSVQPVTAAPGDRVKIDVTAEPARGWHLYALAPRAPATGPRSAVLGLVDSPVFRAQQVKIGEAPVAGKNADDTTSMMHDKAVTWTLEVLIPHDAPRGEHTLAGLVGFQSCNDKTCDKPSAVRFETTIGVGVSPAKKSELTFEPTTYVEAAQLVAAAPVVPLLVGNASAVTPIVAKPAESLATMILFSLLGGLILNLMPCVLPVIGLKILSFVEQAGRARSHVLMLNLFYSAGLISVFLVLATLAVTLNLSWGQQFQSTAFNIVMTAIVFAMALSFLGVWEIPLPAFVGSGKATELAAREGAGGAFAKGVFTTILATPCSGPFLGPVFGFTLRQPPEITYLIFASIGLGMASPYLLIGAFPRLIRFLPKPGAWMDTFKQIMGFVLLGTIVYLFTFLNRDYLVPTFALLVGIWAGLWWVGRTPLYEPLTKILRAWLAGAAVAGAVGWFAFTTLVPGEQILPWKPYSPGALAQATAEGKTVMVDFTAEWCLTCKYNLKFVINTEEVRKAVDSGQVETLLADWTSYSDEIKQTLTSLGSNSIPVLAIFPAGRPHQPIIIPDKLTQSEVLNALKQAGPSQSKAVAATAMK